MALVLNQQQIIHKYDQTNIHLFFGHESKQQEKTFNNNELLTKIVTCLSRHNFCDLVGMERFILAYFGMLLRYVSVDVIMTCPENPNKQTSYIADIPYNMKTHCNALEQLNVKSEFELKFTQIPSLKNKLFKENHFEGHYKLTLIYDKDICDELLKNSNKLFIPTIQKYYVLKNDNFTLENYSDLIYEFGRLWEKFSP